MLLDEPTGVNADRKKWVVCGMLLLALVLNYMDRQTLSLTITAIERQTQITATQYGQLERGFGYAFAVGGLVFGMLADRLSVRWLYPAVLLGWSAAGVATGFADRFGPLLMPLAKMLSAVPWIGGFIDVGQSPHAAEPQLSPPYIGFLFCRVVLGFFEAGQWPCALVTTQRLLSAADRPFGNSILQSGASLGAVLTPFVIMAFDPFAGAPLPAATALAPEQLAQLGWWRMPYVVIGFLGLLWVVPWLLLVGPNDLKIRSDAARSPARPNSPAGPYPETEDLQFLESRRNATWFRTVRRLLALVVVVVVINATWQFFRAWLPKMLEQHYGYSANAVRWFVPAYYIATDIGCLAAGVAVKVLARRHWNIHWARVATFTVCALLTSLSTVAATLPAGWPLLGLLLVIGFGALGLFPNYYSFTQEISTRFQGRVSGSLAFVTWVVSGEMQARVGKHIDQTGSYAEGVFWVGLAPLAGSLALLLLWGRADPNPADASRETRESK
jgi:ACS family hexuronate transporter-like MFS transporter